MGLSVISSWEPGSAPLWALQEGIWSRTLSRPALGSELIAQLVPVLLHPLFSPRVLTSPKPTALLGVHSYLLWLFPDQCLDQAGTVSDIFLHLCFHGLSSEQKFQGHQEDPNIYIREAAVSL